MLKIKKQTGERILKLLILIAMALSISAASYGADLDQNALKTLLTAKSLTVYGDIHPEETFLSIYGSAVRNGANIENTCEVTSAKIAVCTLWLSYNLGETALVYTVYLPGNELVSNDLYVSRGD